MIFLGIVIVVAIIAGVGLARLVASSDEDASIMVVLEIIVLVMFIISIITSLV